MRLGNLDGMELMDFLAAVGVLAVTDSGRLSWEGRTPVLHASGPEERLWEVVADAVTSVGTKAFVTFGEDAPPQDIDADRARAEDGEDAGSETDEGGKGKTGAVLRAFALREDLDDETAAMVAAYGSWSASGGFLKTVFHLPNARRRMLGVVREAARLVGQRQDVARSVRRSLVERSEADAVSYGWDNSDVRVDRARVNFDLSKLQGMSDAAVLVLAFLGLRAFPVLPGVRRGVQFGVVHEAVNGERKTWFFWPLWSDPLSFDEVFALLAACHPLWRGAVAGGGRRRDAVRALRDLGVHTAFRAERVVLQSGQAARDGFRSSELVVAVGRTEEEGDSP